jgi:glycerol-3-phosphate dehydrogenase (NAD(P)+)
LSHLSELSGSLSTILFPRFSFHDSHHRSSSSFFLIIFPYCIMANVAVIGAGGWGTALALVVAENAHRVTLWARDESTVRTMQTARRNESYLPGIAIPQQIDITHKPDAVSDADLVVVAVPTQFIRAAFEQFRFDVRQKLVVSVCKGVERGTLLRVSEVLHDVAAIDMERFADLTGPSHAEEVARALPTTVVAASHSEATAKIVQQTFSRPTFRVYYSNDLVGAELGGAVKNVMAIAAGIVDGLGMGDNTKAALITRGLAEITRLGVAMGAHERTFSGLSGLGDLIVTCASRHSRNRAVGEKIGRGMTLADIMAGTQQVAEGVSSTESVRALARKHGVEMPIVEKVYETLFEGKAPTLAMQELMTRGHKAEYW